MGIACAITTGDWWAPFAIYGGMAVFYKIVKTAIDLIYDK